MTDNDKTRGEGKGLPVSGAMISSPVGGATERASQLAEVPPAEKVSGERACVKCARPVVSSGVGRPRAYCSEGCRRAAEYELRRVERAIEKVEAELAWCRINSNARTDPQVPKYEAERVRLESRLSELLTAGASNV
jgi:predicted nucleic acid-binding Zn ribbon protein